MMREQHLKRVAMHKELQLTFNEFHESKLAIELLKTPDQFESVKKISTAIVRLILANHESITAIISNEPKILDELREPFFGCLYTKDKTITPGGALARIVAVLNDKNTSLDIVMQLHCIFCYRIYPKLTSKKEDSTLTKQLRSCSLFSGKFRVTKTGAPTYALGIVNHSIFTTLLGKHDKLHTRALDIYSPNYQHTFFDDAQKNDTPVVCGPSSHTSSLLLGAKLYGDLTQTELEEYVLACFAFLTAGGNHSFYEVMSVARLIGVDFSLPEYVANRR